MQGTDRSGQGGEEPSTYVIPDLSYDWQREKKGEDNIWCLRISAYDMV